MTDTQAPPVAIHSTQPAERAALTIEDLIHRPGVYIVTITPADAALLLMRNHNNRSKKLARIEDWSRQMREGKWRLTNQGIGVDRNGVLVDGQNRLEAVIRANVPVTFMFATGLDPEARDVVDTGVRRSFGDVLTMNGYRNVSNLAGAVAIRARYENGAERGWGWADIRSRGIRHSHEELLDYMQAHPKLTELAPRSWIIRKALGHVGLAPIVAFESMAAETDPESLAYFRDAVITGGMLEATDPRLLLRNHLMRRERAGDSIWTLGMFIKAWNLWLAGESREVLSLKETEPVPKMAGPEARTDALLEQEQELAKAGR